MHQEARALLRETTFIKVGHHGSHNATSKTLVEDILPCNIPTMISTQAGEGRYRSNIPLEKLMATLDENDIRYVRSDRTKKVLPKGFNKGQGSKWVDLEVPC